LEHACKYHYIERNPAADTITKIGAGGKTPPPYTVEQMQTLMKKTADSRWEMMVVFGGLYGLRLSEIIGLRLQNIDVVNNTFSVVEQMPFKLPAGTKTIAEMSPTKSHERELPITDETLPFFRKQLLRLAEQKEAAQSKGITYYDNGLLICKPNGEPYHRSNISSGWKELLEKFELPHLRFHDLRHTAATNLHGLTGDFYTVGEILGHTLKGLGQSLGITGNLESVTAQYIDVRLDRKKAILDICHDAVGLKTPKPEPDNLVKNIAKKASETTL
jgi:integrase